MLQNKTPNELIELSTNQFSKIEYIWLVPTILNQTTLIGFAFKDSASLEDFKNGNNNNSILIDFGLIDVKLDSDVFDECHNVALLKFSNFEIIK
jgi:hypothetical protein